jgi:cobalt/nickel transport protein
MVRIVLGVLVLTTAAPPAFGHFTMLLPTRSSVKKGETVSVLYQWGHPFEHQIFDALAPEKAVLAAPDGKVRPVRFDKVLVKSDGNSRTAFTFSFTPEQRGDFTLMVQAPPMWMDDGPEFLQDTVQVVVHVQAQKGWGVDALPGFRLVPLTRPYALRPGMTFQARVLRGPVASPRAQAGLPVFMERYNPRPPKELPADEFITFTSKTDPGGLVTCSFPEPGWWSVTAQRTSGTRPHDGKLYPVRERTTFWVYVE